jgi:hypothetical protein
MKNSIEPGIYQHYKGTLHHVLEVCRHSETLDLFVVYRELYGTHGLWVRPLDLFHDNVVIDGVSQPRFTFLHKCEVSEVDPNR